MALALFSAAVAIAALAWDGHAYAFEPKRVIALLLAVVGSAIALTSRPKNRTTTPASLLFAAAFVVLTALSRGWGIASGDLATLLGGAGVALVASRLDEADAIAAARATATVVGGAASLVAIASFALGARGFALHAGQGNPNWLGLLLAVTLPLAWNAARCEWVRARAFMRAATWAAVLAHGPALYLSHSRVAWVAVAIACIVHVYLSRFRGKFGRHAVLARTAPTASIASVASSTSVVPIVLAFALAGSFTTIAMTSRVARAESSLTADAPASVSLSGRVWIWRTSADAAKRALPFGAGLGTFSHAFHEAQADALASYSPGAASHRYVNATTAHDDYLQIAVESGPLALLAFVLAIALAFRDLARAPHASRSPTEGFAGGASAGAAFPGGASAGAAFPGGASALVAFATSALGDSPLRSPAVVLVVALVIGCVRATVRPPSPARESPAEKRSIILDDEKTLHGYTNVARVFPVILIAACAFFLQAETRAWFATRIVTAASDCAPNERAAMLARAIRLDPSSGDALLALGTLEAVSGDPRAALTHLSRADALLCDVGARIAMGNAHLALGESRAAEDEFRVALHRDRGSLRARTGLAEAQRREGDLDAAKKTIAIAATLAPYDPHVIDLRDTIDEEQMDPAVSDVNDDSSL